MGFSISPRGATETSLPQYPAGSLVTASGILGGVDNPLVHRVIRYICQNSFQGACRCSTDEQSITYYPKYNVKRFGYTVIDGSDWSLEIYFSDEDKPFKVYGDNNYPYNFADLYELLSFDKTGASLPGEARGLYFRVEWLGVRS